MVKPKKHLGQHFLTNLPVAEKIANSFLVKANRVLEIGPGKGVLTKFLIPQFKENLKVVEIDGESVEYLIENKILNQNQIIPKDFLKLNLKDIFNEADFHLIGNYPYNISTQIVFKVLENQSFIPEMVGMFQKEVSDRIASSNGSKQFGILSVLAQTYYTTEVLFHVEPGSFFPPPKVRSSVIRLVRKNETYKFTYPQLLRVVKTAFNQRRKAMRNSLKPLGKELNPERIPFLDKRPEQLLVQDFHTLTIALHSDFNNP